MCVRHIKSCKRVIMLLKRKIINLCVRHIKSCKRVIMLLKRANNLCAQDKKRKENVLSGEFRIKPCCFRKKKQQQKKKKKKKKRLLTCACKTRLYLLFPSIWHQAILHNSNTKSKDKRISRAFHNKNILFLSNIT